VRLAQEARDAWAAALAAGGTTVGEQKDSAERWLAINGPHKSER
jgi:hypothetical protein